MSKKTHKKKVIHKSSKKTVSHEIVVRVQPMAVAPTVTDLSEPMKDGKKLTIPKTWMSDQQIIRIVQNTPPAHIYKRPGKGGKEFEYVTTSYVTRLLNFAFGWNWDFDVAEHGREGDVVWVKGVLTVRGQQEGQVIRKTQFGRAEVKYLKNTKNLVDFGNDLKSASSDALKKCASMLGIASDIYGKGDYKQESGKEVVEHPVVPMNEVMKHDESQEVKLKPGQITGPDGYPTYVCEKDGDPISDQEAEYSMKMYGHRLCREHQTSAKKK